MLFDFWAAEAWSAGRVHKVPKLGTGCVQPPWSLVSSCLWFFSVTTCKWVLQAWACGLTPPVSFRDLKKASALWSSGSSDWNRAFFIITKKSCPGFYQNFINFCCSFPLKCLFYLWWRGNIPLSLSGSFDWPNNQIDRRQIGKRSQI